jgi:hypothetical protein
MLDDADIVTDTDPSSSGFSTAPGAPAPAADPQADPQAEQQAEQPPPQRLYAFKRDHR